MYLGGLGMKKVILWVFISLLAVQGCVNRRRIDDAVDVNEMTSLHQISSKQGVKLFGSGVVPHAFQNGVQTFRAVCNGDFREMDDCFEQAIQFCGEANLKVIDKKEKEVWRRGRARASTTISDGTAYVDIEDDSRYVMKRYLIFSCQE